MKIVWSGSRHWTMHGEAEEWPRWAAQNLLSDSALHPWFQGVLSSHVTYLGPISKVPAQAPPWTVSAGPFLSGSMPAVHVGWSGWEVVAYDVAGGFQLPTGVAELDFAAGHARLYARQRVRVSADW